MNAVAPEVRQQHIESACEVFRQHCGRPDPAQPEHWDAVRIGLIRATGDFIIKLLDFVPVTRDLTIERFLSGAETGPETDSPQH
jgi:hypothetical protein